MRILQVTHQYPPDHIGGVELVTQQLAELFARAGHESHVVTRAQSAGRFNEHGLHVHLLASSTSKQQRFLDSFGNPSLLRAFSRILDEIQPDVVLVEHLMGYPLACIEVLRTRSIPYVISLHDYWFVCANAQLVTNSHDTLCDGPSAMRCGHCMAARAGLPGVARLPLAPVSAARNRKLRRVMAGACGVIANSAFVYDFFARQQLVDARWRVIPLGLDSPEKIGSATHHGPMRVAYVGSIASQKGVHHLVQAFNACEPKATLTLAGDTTAFPAYVAELKKSAHHSGMKFSGTLNRKQVWHLLAESDVLVVPSIFHETFNLASREAIFAGCWLIASRLGALTELLSNRPDLGQLVEPDPLSLQHALLQAQDRIDELRASRNIRVATSHPLVERTMSSYAQEILKALESAAPAVR